MSNNSGSFSEIIKGSKISQIGKAKYEVVNSGEPSIVKGMRMLHTSFIYTHHILGNKVEDIKGSHFGTHEKSYQVSCRGVLIQIENDGSIKMNADSISFECDNFEIKANNQINLSASKIKLN